MSDVQIYRMVEKCKYLARGINCELYDDPNCERFFIKNHITGVRLATYDTIAEMEAYLLGATDAVWSIKNELL